MTADTFPRQLNRWHEEEKAIREELEGVLAQIEAICMRHSLCIQDMTDFGLKYGFTTTKFEHPDYQAIARLIQAAKMSKHEWNSGLLNRVVGSR
jgi:hypothetical protein